MQFERFQILKCYYSPSSQILFHCEKIKRKNNKYVLKNNLDKSKRIKCNTEKRKIDRRVNTKMKALAAFAPPD